MIKALIKLRKKTVLPFKWWLKGHLKAKNMSMPSKKDILEARGAIEEDLHRFTRKNYQEEISFAKGQLSILNWFIDGE